jgi:hypothetical protein
MTNACTLVPTHLEEIDDLLGVEDVAAPHHQDPLAVAFVIPVGRV